MDQKELQAKVNPVFTTGKGTASMLAAAGNKDAAAIVSKIDMTGLGRGINPLPQEVQRAYVVGLQARYEISNNMIINADKPNVIDLPSGYTPRAVDMAKRGMHYYGFDLPVVADEVGPIIEGIMPDDLKSLSGHYGVDATNYESMRSKLDGMKGEVIIATDGLLGYFNEPELLSMLDNVKRILKEFGGCWITADATSLEIFGATFGVLLRDNPELVTAFSSSAASKMADVNLNNNSLFTGGVAHALEFLDEQGFKVETTSFADLLPDISTMAAEPSKLQELREAYRPIEMWKMTLKEDAGVITEQVDDKDFGAVLSMNGDVLDITLSGRLDTITSPDLLGKYEQITKDRKPGAVTLDMKDLKYISSAGLRVMNIIYGNLEGKGSLRMINMNDDIKEILSMTGFDEVFV